MYFEDVENINCFLKETKEKSYPSFTNFDSLDRFVHLFKRLKKCLVLDLKTYEDTQKLSSFLNSLIEINNKKICVHNAFFYSK
jgi:hypothetical protein